MKNYMDTNDLMVLVNKAVVPGGNGGCLYGGEQTETLPGGGFHGGRTEGLISTSWNSRY